MLAKRFAYVLATVLSLITIAIPAMPVQAATNLLANPSVETAETTSKPSYWTANRWGNNVAILNYATNGYSGNKSLMASMTSHTDGDAKWMHDPIMVQPNTTYTYTSYYKSSTPTEIDIAYTDINGTVSYTFSQIVPTSTNWDITTATIATPANAVKMTVMHIIAAPGTLQTDDFSLTKNDPIITPPTTGVGAPGTTQSGVSNWQQGATVFPESANEYSGPNFVASLQQLANDGANYVNLLIPVYQPNKTSSAIQPGWNTPSDETLRAAIRSAQSCGLKVMLVLKLDSQDGAWHADIVASNRTAWFTAYGNLLVKYAQLAQQEGASQFSLGTELWGMASNVSNPDNGAQWSVMIDKVRAVFSGKLTYGAQHSGNRSEKFEVSFWPKLDYIGLSAYFPLDSVGSTAEEGLRLSWLKWDTAHIKPLYDMYQKPILFTEIGYRSITNARLDPWDSQRSGTLSMTEQALDYESVFKYFNDKPYLAGSFWWGWLGSPTAGGPADIKYTPQNKTAELVLRTWYNATVSPTIPAPTPTPTPATCPAGYTGIPPQCTATPSNGSSTTATQTKDQYSLRLDVNTTGSINTPLPGTLYLSSATSQSNVVIDIEIYNANWQKVNQKIYNGQNLASNNTQSYGLGWTPVSIGEYHIKVGIFSSDWRQSYLWASFDTPVITIK